MRYLKLFTDPCDAASKVDEDVIERLVLYVEDKE
jgi:hypothetical protein